MINFESGDRLTIEETSSSPREGEGLSLRFELGLGLEVEVGNPEIRKKNRSPSLEPETPNPVKARDEDDPNDREFICEDLRHPPPVPRPPLRRPTLPQPPPLPLTSLGATFKICNQRNEAICF